MAPQAAANSLASRQIRRFTIAVEESRSLLDNAVKVDLTVAQRILNAVETSGNLLKLGVALWYLLHFTFALVGDRYRRVGRPFKPIALYATVIVAVVA